MDNVGLHGYCFLVGAITILKNMSPSMGQWPTYEMENITFMFETSNQDNSIYR
jgi:hypothetical protein